MLFDGGRRYVQQAIKALNTSKLPPLARMVQPLHRSHICGCLLFDNDELRMWEGEQLWLGLSRFGSSVEAVIAM